MIEREREGYLSCVYSSSNWQTYYSKEFDKREYDQTNPLVKQQEEKEEPTDQQLPEESAVSDVKKPELVNYFTLDLDTRVHLLHLLCEVGRAWLRIYQRVTAETVAIG